MNLILIMVALMVTTVIYSAFLILKSDNSLDNHIKILRAIDAYIDETGDKENGLVMLRHMESLNATTNRFWDWGYTRILPKEDFEWIKPYIKE